jgi:hypothetical protein
VGLSDEEPFEYAQETERAVVTYNRDDFLELDRRYRRRDRSHNGIVILNPNSRRFPQGPGCPDRSWLSQAGTLPKQAGTPPKQAGTPPKQAGTPPKRRTPRG